MVLRDAFKEKHQQKCSIEAYKVNIYNWRKNENLNSPLLSKSSQFELLTF